MFRLAKVYSCRTTAVRHCFVIHVCTIWKLVFLQVLVIFILLWHFDLAGKSSLYCTSWNVHYLDRRTLMQKRFVVEKYKFIVSLLRCSKWGQLNNSLHRHVIFINGFTRLLPFSGRRDNKVNYSRWNNEICVNKHGKPSSVFPISCIFSRFVAISIK